MQAIACAANASFSSTRSIWSILSPARLRTFWVAGMGPSPMQEGSMPATAVEAMAAGGFVGRGVASAAQVPQLVPLLLAPVPVSPFCEGGYSYAPTPGGGRGGRDL